MLWNAFALRPDGLRGMVSIGKGPLHGYMLKFQHNHRLDTKLRVYRGGIVQQNNSHLGISHKLRRFISSWENSGSGSTVSTTRHRNNVAIEELLHNRREY